MYIKNKKKLILNKLNNFRLNIGLYINLCKEKQKIKNIWV